MTKHTITNLLFGITFICLLLLSTRQAVPTGWYIVLVMIYFLVIALGSYFIETNFFTYSYCRGSSAKRQIAITFDDGPNPDTSAILDILKEAKAPAAFFLIGKNIDGRDDTLQRIDQDGHLIGTHSVTHHWRFPLQGRDNIAQEIRLSQDMVLGIIHKKPLLFRPPFGVTDPPIAKAISLTGVKSIGWSVRSYDTVISDPDKLLSRISKIKNGDIVLLHEAGLQTKVILSGFIKKVRAQGFEIVPLTTLLGIQAYEV